MAHVFVSYATADRAVADEVVGWLRAAGHRTFLAHHPRDGIDVGEDWKRRLYRELRAVDAVIGVVTSSFVVSHWCAAEVGIADALGCRLMPLRVEAGAVHPLMRELQHADYQADPGQAREEVLRAVRLLDDRTREWREGENPFPGLESFTAARSGVFFGRAVEAREVGNRLRAMSSAGGILAIAGPSGCGKSSMLKAAVVPLFHSDPAWLTVPELILGRNPLHELARALAVTAKGLGLDWSASYVRGVLEARTDGLRRVADDLLAAGAATRRWLLVSIDQAEELFTRTAGDVRSHFARLLGEAIAGPVRVVVAMRSEFLDDLRDLPEMATVPIEAYVLAPLDHETLRDVIERPARVARLYLDDGLAARLVTDTESGEALPLLAFTLRQLADGLPAGGRLTHARYDELGGVHGALTRQADAALADATRASGMTDREVLDGLTRMVTIDSTGRRARRRIKVAGVTEPLRVALQIFVDRRLLLSDTDHDGQVWLTMAHEALFTKWRSLDTAIADSVMALHALRTVEQAAADWNGVGQPKNYLWDEKRLTAAQAALGMSGDSNRDSAFSNAGEFDDLVREFLKASAERVHRIRRRRAGTIITLFSLLVLALIAAGVAFSMQRTAVEQQRIATVRQLISQADSIHDSDPRTALLLDIAAERIGPGGEAQASLVNTLTTTPYAGTLTDPAGPVSSAVFSPDGRTLATGDAAGTVIVWDLTNPGRPEHLLATKVGSVSSVAFSPDGHSLAVGSLDGRVALWDLADLTRPKQLLEAHAGSLFSVAFSPDGRTLAAGDSDGTVIVWNLTAPAQPRQLGSPHVGHTGSVFSVAFSPDGRTVAAASDDGTTVLWDLTNPARPQHFLEGHTSSVNSVAFSPDGRTVATASDDGTAMLWNLTNLSRPQRLRPTPSGSTSKVTAVAFSPDGRTVATASEDGTTTLWDLTDITQPQPLRPAPPSHTGRVSAVAFAPDGRTLATAGSDATIMLWDLTARGRPHRIGEPLTGQPSSVDSVRFSPDGRTLSTTSSDGTVIVRDLIISDRTQPHQYITHASHLVDSLAIAPNGRTLVTSDGQGSVILWDLTDRTQPRPLGPPAHGHHSPVTSAAFSADGHTLATADSQGSVILWDLTDRTQPHPLGPPLSDHAGSVTAMAFAPDGNILATGGSDATVNLWNLTELNQLRDHPIQHACAITGSGLDHAGWSRYIPGWPYQDTCPVTATER